jgi:signal transduction histidine kinase
MNRVVQRFLDISGGTPRADNLECEDLAFVDLEAWLRDLMAPNAARYEVRFLVDFEAVRDITVHADAVALRQAFGNFLENAFKFTPAGGTVSLVATRTPAGVRVAVVDTGLGMSPDRLAAIEEPLAGGAGTPVNGKTGLGIGLALSRNLLGLMGFACSLTSQPGIGTTVAVDIPENALGTREDARLARTA